MSAYYGTKMINKTDKGYLVGSTYYPTITKATEAIDRLNKKRRFFKRKHQI